MGNHCAATLDDIGDKTDTADSIVPKEAPRQPNFAVVVYNDVYIS